MDARERNCRELLFADLALNAGVASARDVAAALQRYWESADEDRVSLAESLQRVGALDTRLCTKVEADVERAVAAADGSAEAALAWRGGIDGSIHTSLRPETSQALMRDGAGARAPLRPVSGDRYQDFQLVGKGGMGVVYLALDGELNRRVAFKMVRHDPSAPKDAPAPETPLGVTPPTDEEDPEDARSFEELKIRFLQEAWVTGAMEHPGVVPVYELGQTAAGIPYYTMRYVKGERTLGSAIKQATDLDARLALLEPFLKICDAISYAHSRQVVHRDLKPENVALGEFGEVIVLDWGLSKMEAKPDIAASMWRSRIEEFRDATDLATLAGALGTPGYMAPEAALGKSEDVDAQSDVYSLGAILFEILTGRMPFRFRSFMEYVEKILQEAAPVAHEEAPGVPQELSDICARALAQKKDDRFATVDELATEVRRWQTEGRLKQQVEDLLQDAESELSAAQQAIGNAAVWHLDRASAACTKVLHLRKDHGRALKLVGEIRQRRERGIRERVRTSRRKVIGVAGFAILAVAAIVSLYVIGILADQREQAEGRVKREQNLVAARGIETKEARRDEQRALRRLANAYAGLSALHLKKGKVAAARLSAARALRIARTPEGWMALARAEAAWAPALQFVLRGVGGSALAFDPAGTRLFVAAKKNTDVGVFGLATGKWEEALAGHGKPVTQISVSRDGTRVCTASGKAMRVWDAETKEFIAALPRGSGKELKELAPSYSFAGPITALAFAPDGTKIFTGHSTGFLVEWDIERGVPTGFMQADGAATTTLHVGRDGKHLYVGDAGGGVQRRKIGVLFDVDAFATGAGAITQVIPAADGGSMHVCSREQRVLMMDLEDTEVFSVFQGPGARAYTTRLSSDRERFFVASRDGALSVWDVQARKLLARLEGGGDVTGFALSQDGRYLAVGNKNGDVRVWDLTMRWVSGGIEAATSIVADRAGKSVYIARRDGSIDVWDVAKGHVRARLRGRTATITALGLDEPRDTLFSASLDGKIVRWNTQTNEERPGAISVGAVPVTALTALPESETVYTGTLHGGIQAWNWRHRRKAGHYEQRPPGQPIAVIFTVDGGKTVVGLDTEGRAHHWRGTGDTAVAERFAPVDLPKELPLLGGREPWVMRDPLRRLIEMENRFGIYLDGFEIKPVEIARYLPHRPRVQPWSK